MHPVIFLIGNSVNIRFTCFDLTVFCPILLFYIRWQQKIFGFLFVYFSEDLEWEDWSETS